MERDGRGEDCSILILKLHTLPELLIQLHLAAEEVKRIEILRRYESLLIEFIYLYLRHDTLLLNVILGHFQNF